VDETALLLLDHPPMSPLPVARDVSERCRDRMPSADNGSPAPVDRRRGKVAGHPVPCGSQGRGTLGTTILFLRGRSAKKTLISPDCRFSVPQASSKSPCHTPGMICAGALRGRPRGDHVCLRT
jgi:hypothetical protein